jgi:hypothetical protein
MLKTTPVLKVYAYDVTRLMNHAYGIDEESALVFLFGGEPFDGATKFATAVFDLDRAELTPDDIGYPGKSGRYTTRDDVFTDLCTRGEVKKGEYAIVCSF